MSKTSYEDVLAQVQKGLASFADVADEWKSSLHQPADYDQALDHMMKHEGLNQEQAVDVLNIIIGSCIAEKEPYCFAASSRIIAVAVNGKVALCLSFSTIPL